LKTFPRYENKHYEKQGFMKTNFLEMDSSKYN